MDPLRKLLVFIPGAKSEFKDEDVKQMVYSNLGLTNILYAAAFVYLRVEDKSRCKISTVPFAFDVNPEKC